MHSIKPYIKAFATLSPTKTDKDFAKGLSSVKSLAKSKTKLNTQINPPTKATESTEE